MENIITEFRVIETDDGFRIEIKGDKEKLRPFFTGSGWGKGWRRGHAHGRPWGPMGFGFPPMMNWFRMGPWWGPWGAGEEGEEENPSPSEA